MKVKEVVFYTLVWVVFWGLIVPELITATMNMDCHNSCNRVYKMMDIGIFGDKNITGTFNQGCLCRLPDRLLNYSIGVKTLVVK